MAETESKGTSERIAEHLNVLIKDGLISGYDLTPSFLSSRGLEIGGGGLIRKAENKYDVLRMCAICHHSEYVANLTWVDVTDPDEGVKTVEVCPECFEELTRD